MKNIYYLNEINNFDEAFLTGTAAEITPIKSIDTINYKTGDNSTTFKFMSDFSEMVKILIKINNHSFFFHKILFSKMVHLF